MFDIIEQLRDFMESGGSVLWWIFALMILSWTLMAERYFYFLWRYPTDKSEALAEWSQTDMSSRWRARRIREYLVSRVSIRLSQNVGLIKILVALCPLFGLLGTVTGMIAVFEVMGSQGSGNARSMATGISMATIPTMAGMVGAISTLYFASLIDAKAKKEKVLLADQMTLH